MSSTTFNFDKHENYYRMFFKLLPTFLQSLDCNRLMITYFAVSGLEVMGRIESSKINKKDIIDWVYSLQIINGEGGSAYAGFRGSPATGITWTKDGSSIVSEDDTSHITMTFCALCILSILGDDFSRLKKDEIIASLKYNQLEDGSFCPVFLGSESDMRFAYCACCIATMLDDWSGIDTEKLLQFIKGSLTYEGCFAQEPFQEGHGGSTYCGIAALSMMGKMEVLDAEQRDRMIEWLVSRQVEGFNGRPNKQEDTCYSWWIGASLQLLGAYDFVNTEALRRFLTTTQSVHMGGFAKHADKTPDPLHAYLGLCGLSLMGEEGLLPIDQELNMSKRSRDHCDRHFKDKK
eukprot:m.43114 g.43114  ORF g.43114 m.43114 type:complete len:347 (-) comp7091_c0_seq2:1119-2159(-)